MPTNLALLVPLAPDLDPDPTGDDPALARHYQEWEAGIPETIGPLSIEGTNTALFPTLRLRPEGRGLVVGTEEPHALKSFARLVTGLRDALSAALAEGGAANPGLLCILNRDEGHGPGDGDPPAPGDGPVWEDLLRARDLLDAGGAEPAAGPGLIAVEERSVPPRREVRERRTLGADGGADPLTLLWLE